MTLGNTYFIPAPAPVASRNGRSSPDREDTRPCHNHTDTEDIRPHHNNTDTQVTRPHHNHTDTEDSRPRHNHTDTEDSRPHHNHTEKSNNGRESENSYSLGEGAVVRLPPSEGGRLECDRIIMADGTAINLFDETDDKDAREKAHKKSRERRDEVRLFL